MPTFTKDAVALHDIATRRVWQRMSHRDAEGDLAIARDCGDTVQEYETTDRDGNPLRVVLQVSKPLRPGEVDQGAVYEFTR